MQCGICGVKLDTWTDRAEHLSQHFTAGQDMSYWLGLAGGVIDAQDYSDRPPVINERGNHVCRCGASFPRYVDGVWHERQMHSRYRVRSAEDESGMNPTPRPLHKAFAGASRFKKVYPVATTGIPPNQSTFTQFRSPKTEYKATQHRFLSDDGPP